LQAQISIFKIANSICFSRLQNQELYNTFDSLLVLRVNTIVVLAFACLRLIAIFVLRVIILAFCNFLLNRHIDALATIAFQEVEVVTTYQLLEVLRLLLIKNIVRISLSFAINIYCKLMLKLVLF